MKKGSTNFIGDLVIIKRSKRGQSFEKSLLRFLGTLAVVFLFLLLASWDTFVSARSSNKVISNKEEVKCYGYKY